MKNIKNIKQVQSSKNSITPVTRQKIYNNIKNWDFLPSDFKYIEYDFMESFTELPGQPIPHRIREDFKQNNKPFIEIISRLLYNQENNIAVSDEKYCELLCKIIHPEVILDKEIIVNLFLIFNEYLKIDGWEIYSDSNISGHPIFKARRIGIINIPLENAKKLFLDKDYINNELLQIEKNIGQDTKAAIGSAKELIETICKDILKELGETNYDQPDLPKLAKMTFEKLELSLQNATDTKDASEQIKSILKTQSNIVQKIAELRNNYGDGHGKDSTFTALHKRHARLVANSAATLVTFLFESFEEIKNRQN